MTENPSTDATAAPSPEDEVSLTTDEDAQQDDQPIKPDNT